MKDLIRKQEEESYQIFIETECKEYLREDDVHNLRKDIDANIQKVQRFATCNFGKTMGATGKRENALVITKLQEAKMWAGKILEAMDSPFPEKLRDEAK